MAGSVAPAVALSLEIRWASPSASFRFSATRADWASKHQVVATWNPPLPGPAVDPLASCKGTTTGDGSSAVDVMYADTNTIVTAAQFNAWVAQATQLEAWCDTSGPTYWRVYIYGVIGKDVLLEPFNNFTAWAITGSNATIVAGRTGTGASLVGVSSNNFVRYSLAIGDQLAYVTVGFAVRINNATGTRAVFSLASDAGATTHLYVQVLTTGAIEIRVGGAAGALIGTTATGVLPINAYTYVELAAYLHDTAGFVQMRVGGTQVLYVTNTDTRNAGTKTVFDTVCLMAPASGITNIFDDLYISVGPGAPFKGSITVP